MKNIYREYLYIPKDKHISTKVFTTHVVLSVISVLACTLAMFASSYAWFSTEVTSGNNMVASNFYEVYAEDLDDTTLWVEKKVYEAQLSEGNKHLFELRSDGAKTGYCRVSITYNEKTEVFYTDQIPDEGYLRLGIRAAAGAKIEFEPFWGDLVDHDREDWLNSEQNRYGNPVSELKTMIRLFSLRSVAEEEDNDPGDFIPGPRTPSKEYQFPQYGMLEDIAAFYEIEVEDILIFNGIEDPEEIEIGDWLDLPYVDEDAEDFVPTPPDIEHEVLEGETIESIAELYDISIEELIEYNELEPVEIEEEEPEEEPGAVEPGVPMEQPEWMEEQEEIEEPEEPDINELYPLTPGDIILIPFEAASGYTPSDAVYEEDLPAVEPGTGEFVVIEPDSVLNSGSDEEQAQPDEEEKLPSYEEQLPPEEQQSGGILSVGGSLSNEQEDETTDEQQSDVTTEEEQPQQGGILSAGS